MTETITGKVEIQTIAGVTTIDLNPGKRYLRIFDMSGKQSIFLNGAGHFVRIFDMSGKDALTLDTKAAGGGYAGLFLGGGSRPGILVMRDGAGKDSITLNGSKKSISVNDAGGIESVRIDGHYRNMFLKDSKGRDSIVLDQQNHRIFFLDLSGNWGINLDGDEKKIIMKNDSGKDTIDLNGNSGDIFLANADCAEDFDIMGSETIQEPGTVMVIEKEGELRQSTEAYDKRVAGIISGGGDCKPGIVLDKKKSSANRKPLALMGKVFCKVDSEFSPIEAGDLLTTSYTPGHAMRATDPVRTFGAVIGKALRPLKTGKGLIPILVSLQ